MHMAMGVRRLCLWPYGYGYAYGPMDITMAPMSMTLCLWPYAYGPIAIPMAVAMTMPIVYSACVDKNIGYKDGA